MLVDYDISLTSNRYVTGTCEKKDLDRLIRRLKICRFGTFFLDDTNGGALFILKFIMDVSSVPNKEIESKQNIKFGF